MIIPSKLSEGDLIYITAPAKATDVSSVMFTKEYLEQQGFNVLLSQHCLGSFHYFSGTDEQRAADLQFGIDHPEVKAILCARGGYGCVRIVDQVNWANMLREPRWLIGFSDVTVFHHRLMKLGIQSIHGSMPLNFEKNSPEALHTLLEILRGGLPVINGPANHSNKLGTGQGTLIGGNLSIVYSLLGTDDRYSFDNTILFIEDLAEQLYHLDRMFYALKKSGALAKIKGLVIGGMTDLEDTDNPTGFSIEEIVCHHFSFSKIPICFQFPVGHFNDNRSVIIGSEVQLTVSELGSTLSYLKSF
ncbi:MAG: S66 peptidase family protein [Crocinitomicaceae bacterium]